MKRFLLLLISITFFAAPTFAGWTAWTYLDGEINSDPSACTSRGITYVVARGLDNKMWYRKRTLSTGAPSVSCRVYNNQDLMIINAIGDDYFGMFHNYHFIQNGVDYFSDWMGFYSGGVGTENKFAMGAGATTPRSNVNYVPALLARGHNNLLYNFHSPAGQPSKWVPISPVVFGDPAGAYQSAGRLDVVIQGSSANLIHTFQEGGLWYPFQVVAPGTVTSSPDLISRSNGTLDLFVRGLTNNLMHKRWVNGVWGNTWVDLGSPLSRGLRSGSATTPYASNARMFVFARGYDNALWYRAWAP